MNGLTVVHFGSVRFAGGSYQKASGSGNWTVQPIAGFGQAIGPPLGQVRIQFVVALSQPYAVLLTPWRTENTPMLGANYGDTDENGFVVHLFEPVASRTLQNGNFAFAVLVGEL
ncbi:MAG: hypothetical protein JOZ62_19380 [Acidobacteriaceae bacterium]|nr:hypothetical protein [Acidobacteriaceae bacterium]